MEFALEISCETCWGFGRLKIAFCDKVSSILNQAISQLLLVSILLLLAHTLPEGFHHKICALFIYEPFTLYDSTADFSSPHFSLLLFAATPFARSLPEPRRKL